MKILTIAIPTYNGEQNLARFIPLSHIDSNDLEYLIVDDGSKDNTLKVAKDLSKKYVNIRVIHQENQGVGGVYNTIFREANSKYLYILDSDDYLNINTLKQDIKIIKKLNHENIDVFINHFIYENKHSGKVRNDGIENNVSPNKIFTIKDIKRFKPTTFFMNHNLIVKTDLFRRYKLILPCCHYCDNQFLAYIFMYAKKYYFIPKVLCHYQIGNNSQSVSETSMAKNYEQHLISLKAVCQMITKNEYKKMKTHHHRRVVLHYVFMTAFLALFSTYLIYSEERHHKYNECIKYIKKTNPYLYLKILSCHMFFITNFIPRKIAGKFFVKGKRKFIKDIAFDY